MLSKNLFGAFIALIVTAAVVCAGQKPISNDLLKNSVVSAVIKTGSFRSPLLKRNLDFRVFAPAETIDKPMPMVVYLKNLAVERIGQVSDSELISSFLRKGMLVVELDYQKDPKAKGANMYIDVMYLYRVFGANGGVEPGTEAKPLPPLMKEFIRWDDAKIKTYQKFVVNRAGKSIEYKINPLWVYVIPAGYTIDRNIEVSTIKTDLRTVVHRMDVIHPASPAHLVPAVLEISTKMPLADNYFRQIKSGKTPQEILATIKPYDPETFTRINRNSCYVFTWTMAGYAGVIMDNVANHVTSNWIYGKEMTVPTGPYFPEKRALRLLRARKSDFGLSGKVAIMGISKCNMRAIVSALVNGERPNTKYITEVDKGPYADESDRFDAMIVGGLPKRPEEYRMILDYLSDDDPPLVWCQTVYLSRMRRASYVQELLDKRAFLRQVEKRCEAFGLPYKDFFGTPIGHDFDYIYFPYIISFVDKYLK